MTGAAEHYPGGGHFRRRPLTDLPMNGMMQAVHPDPTMHWGRMQPSSCGPMKGIMHLQGTNVGQVYPRRPTPYPSPAMLMDQKRSQYPSGPNMQQTFPPGYSPPQHGGGPQFQQQTTSPDSSAAPRFGVGPQAAYRFRFPTPPYSPVDRRPPCKDNEQAAMWQCEEETRVALPVKEGVILGPFSLPHDLSVINRTFHLKPRVFRLLRSPDLDLQLLCFHEEGGTVEGRWPAAVEVSVNASPLYVDRGDDVSSAKALYLKEVVQAGCNTIQFSVSDCVCSHLFLITLVHRAVLQSLVDGLMDKQLLSLEDSVAKIKRSFSDVSSTDRYCCVEENPLKVPLKCPIMSRKMELPARGQDCRHLQCFDLVAYLQLVCDTGVWVCPICGRQTLLERLEIDQYIWRILHRRDSSEVEEVEIDAEAVWRPSKMVPGIEMADTWLRTHTTRMPPEGNPPSSPDDFLPSLHFDPMAVINGEGTGLESLRLLPDFAFDPEDFLSFLDGIDLGPTIPSSWTSTYDEMDTSSESPLDVLIKHFGENAAPP